MASAVWRCNAPRSDCLYSSSQPRPSHFSPSKIEFTERSVFRSTSVSSRRRIIVPLFRRAYSQLKMKVRALPTWRNPVGDGAKRTRGLKLVATAAGFGIYDSFRTFDGTGHQNGPSSVGTSAFSLQPFDFEINRRRAVYLKPVVFQGCDMKPLRHCFPPKASRQAFAEVSLPTL